MNIKLTFAALGAAAVGFAVPALSAVSTPVLCSDSTTTIGNAGYIACQGPTAGNIAPGQTNTATFAGFGSFALLGATNDGSAGPFASNPGEVTSGMLTFDSVQKGLFVLGIKGGPDYSLYLFDGGVAGIASLSFDTFGIFKGNGQPGPELSHAALFTQAIPEPETYALMLAGLGVIAFVARRRRPNA